MFKLYMSNATTIQRSHKFLLDCVRIQRNSNPDDTLWLRISKPDLPNSVTSSSSASRRDDSLSESVPYLIDLSQEELVHREENKWIREVGNVVLMLNHSGLDVDTRISKHSSSSSSSLFFFFFFFFFSALSYL